MNDDTEALAARAERDALRAQVARVEALVPLARRIVNQTNTTCRCPDEPHQNALHDLAHDLLAALYPTDLPREVWDGSVAPGGYVCSICGVPTESEPCEHLSALHPTDGAA